MHTWQRQQQQQGSWWATGGELPCLTLTASRPPPPPVQDFSAGQEEDLLDRDAQVAAIEDTFRAAAEPPVHHRDPSLQPVQVLPGAWAGEGGGEGMGGSWNRPQRGPPPTLGPASDLNTLQATWLSSSLACWVCVFDSRLRQRIIMGRRVSGWGGRGGERGRVVMQGKKRVSLCSLPSSHWARPPAGRHTNITPTPWPNHWHTGPHATA